MSETMTIHDDVEAYALGALDTSDRDVFERHLPGCSECRAEISGYVPVIHGLGRIPVALPPPSPALSFGGAHPVPSTLFSRYLGVAAAAVFLVAAGVGAAVMRHPATDTALMSIAGMLADGPRTMALTGDTNARGRMIVGHRQMRTAFVVRGLPPAPAGEVYEVWSHGSGDHLIGSLAPARENLSVLLVDGNLLAQGARSIDVSLERANATTDSKFPILSGRV